jgi:hypothetical protein
MGRKITKERVNELQRQKFEREKLQKEGKTVMSHRMQTKKKMRQEKETKWAEKLKNRGGFTPKRAKHWGDPCSYDECVKWEEGECAYQERDTKGCYMNLGEK